MKTVSILTHTDKTPMSIGMHACTHTHTHTHTHYWGTESLWGEDHCPPCWWCIVDDQYVKWMFCGCTSSFFKSGLFRHEYERAQSCPTLRELMDCCPPGSSVRGIFQARILEWVAISFSGGFFPTQGLNLSLLHLLHWQVISLPLCHLGSPSNSLPLAPWGPR